MIDNATKFLCFLGDFSKKMRERERRMLLAENELRRPETHDVFSFFISQSKHEKCLDFVQYFLYY
jgi:hypothetical protein